VGKTGEGVASTCPRAERFHLPRDFAARRNGRGERRRGETEREELRERERKRWA